MTDIASTNWKINGLMFFGVRRKAGRRGEPSSLASPKVMTRIDMIR